MATVKFRQKSKQAGKVKKGELTIYAIFTFTRSNRFEIKTDEKVEPRFWNPETQLVKSNHAHYHEINTYLADFRNNLITLWRANRDKGFDHFKKMLHSGSQKKTLLEVYGLFLEAYEKEKSKNTAKKYGSLKIHIENFTKSHPFNIDGLDFKFYDQFKEFLYTPSEGKENRDSTVFKYIVNMQTFLTWATDRGFPVNQIYKRWEVINRETDSISFSKEELARLESAILPRHLAIARDYQIIECRTGMRISDIRAFDIKNLSGTTYWYFQTKGDRMKAKKTFVDFSRAYCAPALELLARHNFNLPEMPEQKLNEHIKSACREAGIKQPITKTYWRQGKKITETKDKCDWITTHVGRKTFITLAAEAGMPLIKIAQTLNISLNTVQKHYVAPIQSEDSEKYFKLMQA